MRSQIRASNPGHPGAHRAGRFFANGVVHAMEVVELEKAQLDAQGNGPLGADGKPDMTKIDPAGYARIKADFRFSVFEEGTSTSGMVSGDLLEAARKQASEAAGALSDAKLQIEALRLEIATLKSLLEEATKPGQTEGDDSGRGSKAKGGGK